MDQHKWPEARRARYYLRTLRKSFEGRLGCQLIMVLEKSLTETKGYWIRWVPKEIYVALSNT